MTDPDGKYQWRQAARRVRAEAARSLTPAAAGTKAALLAIEFFRHPDFAGPVAGYWPIRDEIDPRPLMDRLYNQGRQLALPVMGGPTAPLIFRNWCPGDRLAKGPMGIFEPLPAAPVVTPQVLLVPLLAFDQTGHRLGYGGGYYDRTIASLRSQRPILRSIGLAYAAQEMPDLPALATDMKLDGIVTEHSVLSFPHRERISG